MWISWISMDFSMKIHGFHVGLLDGLLGVAGMMTLLVMTGIPENSLRKTQQ